MNRGGRELLASTTRRRVVVTGVGCITPVATNAASTFAALLEGRSGVGRVTSFDASAHDCKIAGEVLHFDVADYVANGKNARRMDRFTQFALASAEMALASSGLDLTRDAKVRTGVVIGTALGGLQVIEREHSRALVGGPRRVSPFTIPMFLGSAAAGQVAISHGLRGPSLHIATACASGTHSIGEATSLIRRGAADVMLAGGAESPICPMSLAGFSAAQALSTRNVEPSAASRPFDRDRDGFVLGEGAGVVVLEEETHARRRGANIWGEVVGYGLSNDAHHMTAPDETGRGATLAMAAALADAGLEPEAVGYVNAHGTSTLLGDIAECNALCGVFGEHARKHRLWVSSTKSMIGHLLGAAGAVEAIVCLQSLCAGRVHPTINLSEADPRCGLDFVPNVARDGDLRVAMSNSFGFGGYNASLVFARY